MCDTGERGHASERVTAAGAEGDKWRAVVRCRLLIFRECQTWQEENRRRVVVSTKDTGTIADARHTSNVQASPTQRAAVNYQSFPQSSHTSPRQSLAVGLVSRSSTQVVQRGVGLRFALCT